MQSTSRLSYDGVVLAAPVTIPYARYSIETAQWWIGQALKQFLTSAGIAPGAIDGLSISRFTLAPDSAVGFTQHFGLCVRWLDIVPLGGVSGIAALRRAARAVQSRDADIVTCSADDTNQIDTFRRTLANFSSFSQDAVYPAGRVWCECALRADRAQLHAPLRRHAGGFRQDSGRMAPERAVQPARIAEQAGAAGGSLGLVEGMRQVLGFAGPTQVSGANTALVSGFGMINYDRGLSSGAAILAGRRA